MYGKLFQSTYTGSMVGSGANVFAVWGYIVANTIDSYVEVNPTILATIIGCPKEEIESALALLSAPDPGSRSKEYEGRRIISTGEYSYYLPTFKMYHEIKNESDRKEYMRVYMQKYRLKKRENKTPNPVNINRKQSKTRLTQTETEPEPVKACPREELPIDLGTTPKGLKPSDGANQTRAVDGLEVFSLGH